MKIIVGLGNPGIKYETTRHNVGFIAADLIADDFDLKIDQKGMCCLYHSFFYHGEKIILVKPQTYMNLSGECVGQIARYYKVENEDILVIADDLSLPVGTLRFRAKGSSGGHNGLKSIIAHLQGDDFPRLKIGIGQGNNAVDHVLGHFNEEEWAKVAEMIEKAKEASLLWLKEGDEAVMNGFNVYSKLPKPPKPKKEQAAAEQRETKAQPPLIPLTEEDAGEAQGS
ncbi:MAG TPA: aminoacyl-tRNA hydrolase [Clostridiales bacterium]|nr:aminoacyl-tRNA hydrolase [Clostridiales bacterium]